MPREDGRDDFTFAVGGILTLLALILGFAFSMAVTRYDQRKDYEEQEANATGTEYLRANRLKAADTAIVHSLLKSYLDQRILLYVTRDEAELGQTLARLNFRQNCGRPRPLVLGSSINRHKRCVEHAGIHAIILAESNPPLRPDPGFPDPNSVQFPRGLFRASNEVRFSC